MAEELIFRIDIEGNEKTLTELARVKGELSLVAKEQSELNAQLKKGKITLDEYAKATADLDAKKRNLKNAGDELSKTMKQQEQAFKGAEGSMVRVASELNVLRDRYRNLSQAERENQDIGGKLLTQIQAKDTEIKKLDASIGNHQRNVGNYSSVWGGLTGQLGQSVPVFGNVINVMQGVGSTMESVTMATGSSSKGMLALGGAIGIGIAAFGGLVKIAGDVIDSSDALGDKWAEVTTGMKFAYDQFLRALASGDFSNFITKMEEAIEVGKRYAQTLDELENRTRSLSIRESENTLEVDKLRLSLKNVNLTAEERKKIAGEIVELERKIAVEKTQNAKLDFDNEMMVLKMQTNLGEATIRRYLKEYTANSDLVSKATEYLELQKSLQKLMTMDSRTVGLSEEISKIKKAMAETSSEARIYSTVVASMGKASPEQIQKATDKWVALNNVTHEFNQSVERAITTGNRMEAQQERGLNKQITLTKKLVDLEEKRWGKIQEDAERAAAEYDAAISGDKEDPMIAEMRKREEKKQQVVLQYGLATEEELYNMAFDRLKKEHSFEMLSIEQQAALTPILAKMARDRAKNSIMTVEEVYAEYKSTTGTPIVKSGGLGITGFVDSTIQSTLEGIGITGTSDQMKEYVSAVKRQVAQLASDLSNMWMESQQNRIRQELKAETAKVDQQTKKELSTLDQSRKKRLITEAQYNAEKERIEENAARKKDQLNKEAFEKDKKLKLQSTLIAGALSVVQMLASPGGIMGVILAAFAALTAGIQYAKISATKYEGAMGGLLVGPSHANGGIKYAYGGNIVELEGGEGVINKRSLASGDVLSLTGTPMQIASDLNSYKGYGVRFGAGGYTPVSTYRNPAATVQRKPIEEIVDERIQATRVYVVESDITETQSRVKKIETEASW